MSKKVIYKENQELPVISSYLERIPEEVLKELSNGRGEDDE